MERSSDPPAAARGGDFLVEQEPAATMDTLFDGALVVCQDKGGYRFSIDAVLLAGLTRVKASDRVVDLGTGCGVVLLILAYRKLGRSLFGIEIQADLAALACQNVVVNGFSDQLRIMALDFREVSKHLKPESFDLVLSNPPYRPLKTGRINPSSQRAIARHELTASLVDVFAAARYLLPLQGRLAVIYPAVRLNHLLLVAHQHGFSPKQLTVIHSSVSSRANLVHLEFRKGGGEELRIGSPFFIYGDDGSYSESMRKLYKT